MAVSGWGVFLIIIVVVLIGGGGGYIIYAHYRARKLGLPPPNFNPFSKSRGDTASSYRGPQPAPGGVQGWITDQWHKLRSGRTAGGAYESTGYAGATGGGSRRGRGFGALDPDEAWDARVGDETGGYYEEQELGLQDPSHGPYGGGGYGDVGMGVGVGGIEEGRGRSRSRQRELDDRYDAQGHGDTGSNPFGDHAQAASLRSVSPRPEDGAAQLQRPVQHKRGQSSLTAGSTEESPTERRSMFREDV